MKFFKNLDKASKILIGSSVIVFVLSAFAFIFYEGIVSNSLLTGEIFGEITQFKQDTRLKRSSAIDWRPVTTINNLHANDSVFTGKNSSANLGLANGTQVTLQPNSLIVIQKNRLLVEAGTIDIELAPDAEPIEIRNANGVTILSQPGKYQANANNVKPKALEEIKLLLPAKNSRLSYHDAGIIELSWSAPSHLKEFQIEIWGTKKDQAPVIHTSVEQSLKVNLSDLPVGIINWKVSVKDTPIISESSFYLSNSRGVKLLSPQNKEVIQITLKDPLKNVAFSWEEESHEAEVTLQISQDPLFTTLSHELKTKENTQEIKIENEGTYFWRVGINPIKPDTLWTIGEFVIFKEKKIVPLEIILAEKKLDFTKQFNYITKVIDQNNCEAYNYQLYLGEQLLNSVTQPGKNFQIEKILNGHYRLSVTCLINNIEQTKSDITFEVLSTPVLKKPKLIKNKNELFVRIFKSLSNLLIAEAQAEDADPTSVNLAWEGDVQDENVFEITIIEKESSKVIVRKLLPTNAYSFKATSPGIYLWKVRERNWKGWGPYSEWGEINAFDKVTLLTDPLMLYPLNNETILINKEDKSFPVEFKWKTPDPDFEYTLEVYVSPEAAPIFTIPMKGNSKKLKFKKKNATVWWKVLAKSRFGNKTLNSELYSFSFKEQKTKFVFPDIVAKLNFGSLSGKLNQELPNSISSSNSSLNLETGTFASMGLDILRGEKTYTLLYATYNGSGDGQNFTKQEVSLRYGQPFLKRFSSHHSYYLGLLYSATSEDFYYLGNDNTPVISSGQFKSAFLSFKYLYKKPMGQKFSFEISPDLLVRAQFSFNSSSISLRNELKLNYTMSSKFWISAFLNNEFNQNQSPLKNQGESIGTITSNNILSILGLGVAYKF